MGKGIYFKKLLKISNYREPRMKIEYVMEKILGYRFMQNSNFSELTDKLSLMIAEHSLQFSGKSDD